MGSAKDAKDVAESWLKSVGVSWDQKAIDIRQGPPGDDSDSKQYSGVGLGVWAIKDIKDGDIICNIPKSALLSIRNTEVSDLIEEEELGGGLGLVFAVLYEMSVGEKSKWHGYFQSMPSREYLPIFWTEDELSLLKGTELEERVKSDRELTRGDYDENIAPLLKKYPDRLPSTMTYDNFTRAASLVASRAFGVDEWHGESMVPLADIFNHKASIVSLSEEYMIAEEAIAEAIAEASKNGVAGGSDDGADIEGSEGHDKDEEEIAQEDEEDDEEAEDSDVVDDDDEDKVLFSGGTRPPPILASAGTDGVASALRLEIGICSDDDKDELQIIAASDIRTGAEVHNTYGELGNAELVCKYGFALRENPFDCVALDKSAFVDAVDHVMPKKAAKARIKFLLEHTALLDDSVEPLEVMTGACIGAALAAALHVLGASADDFKAWKGMEDAFPWLAVDGGVAGEGKGDEGIDDMEAPEWVVSGSLQLASESTEGSGLTHQAREILARTLAGEYKRKFGPQNIEDDDQKALAEAEKQAVQASDENARDHAAATCAALALRLGEKKLMTEALNSLPSNPENEAAGVSMKEEEGQSKRAKV